MVPQLSPPSARLGTCAVGRVCFRVIPGNQVLAAAQGFRGAGAHSLVAGQEAVVVAAGLGEDPHRVARLQGPEVSTGLVDRGGESRRRGNGCRINMVHGLAGRRNTGSEVVVFVTNTDGEPGTGTDQLRARRAGRKVDARTGLGPALTASTRSCRLAPLAI